MIEPLPLPDLSRDTTPATLMLVASVELFVERAQAVRSDWRLSETNAAAVSELCVRLDGLPLAIELAAGRSALLEPRELLARLQPRLNLLSDGPRDAPPRHQTLRGAIAWSYELLAPADQRLSRRLGVFAGGCTVAAAKAIAICEDDDDTDLLNGHARLVDHSLLRGVPQPGGGLRVEMLETIREFALEQLELADELAATQRRHADYWITTGEKVANPRLDEPDGPALLAQLECEHDNLRAALRWLINQHDADASVQLVGAFWSFWEKRGHWAEGLRWTHSAIDLADTKDAFFRGRALLGAAILHRCRSEFVIGARLARESEEYHRNLPTRRLTLVLLIEADLLAMTGDFDSATALAAESVALRRQSGDGLSIAWGCS
jgi:predicted ATPase